MPWSIRGIDDDIRDAARLAARRSGLSVAEWLNDVIARQASAEGIQPRRPPDDDLDDDAEPDAAAVTAALQRLTRRLRTMDESSRAALTDLQLRLDEIVQRLGAAAHVRGDRTGRASSLRGVATIVDELSRDIDNADEKARSSVEGLRARAGRREGEPDAGANERLAATTERITSPMVGEPAADLETIKTRLDALLAGAPGPPASGSANLDEILRLLEIHVDEARNRLAASPGPARPVTMSPDEEDRAHRIEKRIAEIAAQLATRRTGPDISAAVAEISARQRSIDEQADFATPAAEQPRVPGPHVAFRADAATPSGLPQPAGTQDRDPHDDAGLRRLDAIAEEIAALRRMIEAADGSGAVARLEMRVAELARAVDATLKVASGGAGPGIEETIGRLDARLELIAERLDRLSGQPNEAIDEIRGRLAMLVERLGGSQSGRADPAAALAEIRSELADLRRDLAERDALGVEHIAQTIGEFSRRIDAATLPAAAGLKRFEDDLSRLRDELTDNRQESVEAARMAAREVARQIVEPAGDSDLVRALKTDLENIRAAAGAADRRTQETLGSVHEMLARVVDRLSRLERDAAAEAETVRQAARATGTYGAAARPPQVEATSPANHRSAAPTPAESPRPAPAAGKPDIAALRELARSAANGQREAAGDRKADYIAAARRAAQSAAADVTGAGDDGERKPGAFARIGHAIRNRRRPLLLAAALIVALPAIAILVQPTGPTDDRRPDAVAADLDAGVRPDAAPMAPVGPGEAKVTASAADGPTTIAFAGLEAGGSRLATAIDAPPATGFVRSPAAVAPLEAAIGPPGLRAAAAAGDANAAVEVAARYAEGRLVQRDLATAAYWYERAARSGIALAQYRLAGLYERGEGVATDRVAAALWYQRAADQGNIDAMHNLAVMMSDGVEGAPNYAKAVEYFDAAANRGVTDSQYNLAVVHARGLGTARNLVESYKWFALAATAGDAEAGVHRDEIGKRLSDDELAEARRAVAAWRAIPVNAEANRLPTGPDRSGVATAGIGDADRRSLVRKIQTLLAEHGYDPGPADGFVGPKTQEAVRAYQRNVGLAETGEISSDLVAVLVEPSR